ncbi:M1 family metallopeptidase [Nocardia tenerifensis]|nr:M1 family metallopeptidase [Nocardia tenerifensis]
MGAVLVAASAAVAVAEPADPLVGSPGLGDPYYPMDGNGGYYVRHYDIGIDYDPPTHQLVGKARIEATAQQGLKAFNLDFNGPPVRKVLVNGQPAGFDRNGEHELTLTPAQTLVPLLPFTVEVEYEGPVSESKSGKGWAFLPSGGAVVAGQPHSARSWYPLNDTLANRATFTLTVSVPEEWDAVSIGEKTKDTVEHGRHIVTWESKDEVLGYLTMMAIDKFSYLEGERKPEGKRERIPLLSAFSPGAKDKREYERRLPEIIEFIEDLYGPYPFLNAGGVFLDLGLAASLETQTRPVYADWAGLATVVHEITHQWWGDSTSIQQWADICLNECFAEYTASYLWPERKNGADVDKMYRDTIARHRDDAQYWRVPLHDAGRGHEFESVYDRGPLFMHALRRQLGDQTFFAAVRDFYLGHERRSTSMAEFCTFIQTKSATRLDGFFDAWLHGTTMPAEQYLFAGALSVK